MYLHEILSDIRLALAVSIFCAGAASGMSCLTLLYWIGEREKKKRKELSKMRGVDISHYQDGMRMNLLPQSGYKFAIMKVSEGRGLRDRNFDSFYAEAMDLGIPVGAYVFSHATTPDAAVAEAKYALSVINGRELPLGIYMDVETSGQMSIPKSQLRDTAKAFCRTVEQAGYRSGIYGSEYNAWARLDPYDFPKNLIWVAHYGKEPEIPCDIWQSSDNGRVAGYVGAIDTDQVMSDRMKNIISGHNGSNDSDGNETDSGGNEPDLPYIRPDISVMMLQAVMACNGYWNEDVDGIRTDAFRERIVEFAKDVASC